VNDTPTELNTTSPMLSLKLLNSRAEVANIPVHAGRRWDGVVGSRHRKYAHVINCKERPGWIGKSSRSMRVIGTKHTHRPVLRHSLKQRVWTAILSSASSPLRRTCM